MAGEMTYGQVFLYGGIGLTVVGAVMIVAGSVYFRKKKKYLKEILYLIFDYPHKHYTFKYFEV